MSRSVTLVAHTGREDIRKLACSIIGRLNSFGFQVKLSTMEGADLAKDVGGDLSELGNVIIIDGPAATAGTEVAVVLGGDGTFLRAAEQSRAAGVPLLGVNLGHVGFLAETELDAIDDTVSAIVDGRYSVDQRMTLEVTAVHDGQVIANDWALNEASVEKYGREKMLELAVSVDDSPLLRFGCDGLICATPTGSTAYAFSVGGPVVWPDVEAMLVIPNAAHALFNRALVVSPTSVIDIGILTTTEQAGVLNCDGRRSHRLPAGARLQIRRSEQTVLIARPHPTPFGQRLVAKFGLPVHSFRDNV